MGSWFPHGADHQTRCEVSSVSNASSAFSTSSRRIDFSSFGGFDGSPRGCGIATLGTMRLAPTVFEIGTIEQMCTAGKPARSNSLTIVAPQRVQVPHVEVRMTACTPSLISLAAIS